MAESGIKEIGVDLIKDSVEVIHNCPSVDSWSLGCDIVIDDVNAELQEIRVADIILSGNITTGEITVDIDSQKEIIDLGVSAIVNGINSALTESQIVPYENILKITTISPEATNETRYASSAFSAKAIYDLITSVGRRVDTLESTNEQGGVINKDVADRLDRLEKNQFFERYDDQTIKTKYNLFSDHEISAFGLNVGTGGGSGGEGGASYLKDLWDVTIVSAANDDILVYNGTHWVNKPQSSIMPDLSVLNNYLLKTEAAELYLVKDAAKDFASASSVTDLSNALVRLSETYGDRLNALEKIVQWFHLTQDEQAIYTEKNFYSEKEISAHGLNLGGGSGEGGVIELGNIIGVSLHSPVTGDVFVYNGTHWTNISQSELVPDLSGYATTDSVSTVSNKVKSLEDRLNDLESEKFFFKLEGADDVIYTPYNLFSEKEISAHGLNYGSGSGASGLLTDLLDVKAENSTSGDLLVFDGTHWINTPQSAIVPSIDTSVIATREWVGQNYASASDLSNGVKDAKAYTDALRTHVNEQDQILSGQISKILDWFSLEDGVLLTKYNLASEKEVSAKGINASQGGGTSYNRLDSWSAYDSSKAGYVLSALLGYDLYTRVTNLENAEVDLSDYYTKSQTNSQIASAIGAIDLSPYATKEALNILEGKHNTLRNEFDALSNLLSSDTTDYINTWNEVVAFLDGYKDESDLATILSGMNADISSRLLASDFESWKTNTFTPLASLVANHTTRLDGLDQSILSINTRIDGVDKTIEDHIAEFIAFRANFEISDDLILVRKNFASTEEVSAKGINQGTGGGGGSSYSRLDTWEGYDSNKAGYVLSAGLGYGLKVAIDELNGYDLDNRVRSIENSYVSKDAGGVVNGGLVVSSLAVAGGSSSQFLKADGSLDSTSYLSTEGGTLHSNSYVVLRATSYFYDNGDAYSRIYIAHDGVDKAFVGWDTQNGTILYNSSGKYLGIKDDGTPYYYSGQGAYNTLLHTGNFNPSGYLPLSGGTLSRSGRDVLTIDTSDSYGPMYQLSVKGKITGAIGHIPSESMGDYGLFISNADANTALLLASDRELYFSLDASRLTKDYTLIHSGNIGDYALPLSGGFVNAGNKAAPIEINSTSPVETAIHVMNNGVSRAWFGWHNTQGAYIYNSYNQKYLGILDNGTPYFGANELLHTGNIGEYAGIYSSSVTIDLNEIRDGFRAGKLYNSSNAANAPAAYRGFLEYGTAGFVAQFNSDDQNNLFYRWCENGTWLPWKTIAFTDSDITGNAAGLHYKDASLGNYYIAPCTYGFLLEGQFATLRIKGTNIYNSQVEFADKDDITRWSLSYRGANNADKDFYLGKLSEDGAYTPLMALNYSSENVLIGTTKDASKLTVSTKYRTALPSLGSLSADSDMAIHYDGDSAGYGMYFSINGQTGTSTIQVGSNDGNTTAYNLLLNPLGGNVLIGTATDNGAGAKLQVESANNMALSIKGTTYPEASIRYEGSDGKVWTAGKGIMGNGDSFGFYSVTAGRDIVTFTTEGVIINGTLNAGTTTLSSLYVSSDIVTNRIIIGGVTLSTEDGVLKIESDMYATGEISAHGLNKGESGGGGSSYSRLDTWIGYDSSKAGYVLSAGLGYDLKLAVDELNSYNLNSRLATVESNYLSKNGGTINGYFGAFSVKRYEPYASAIKFENSVGILGYIGINDDYTPLIWDKDLNTRTLLHSGNVGEYAITPSTIGSQSVAYAANAGTLAGISLSNGSNTPWGTIPNVTEGGWMDVGKSFEFHYDNTTGSDYSTVLMCTGNYANIVYLPSASGTLALTTDNVAGAQKLVDGSGNPIIHNNGSIFYIGDTIYPTVPTHILGSELLLRYGASAAIGLILNSSGNVGIGTTDPKEKLDVDSTFRVFNATNDVCLLVSSTASHVMRLASLNTAMSAWYAMSLGYNNQLYLNPASTKNNYVGINTDNPIYQLHVDGTGYFSGALTANDGLTVNGILTVGGASIHPTANTPYFQLYQNNNYWYWQADNSYTYIGGTMSKALRIDQDGNTLIRGSLGVDALLTASNGLTVSKGISATDGIVSDWITAANITANTSASIAALTVSGLSTLTGGIATNDIHGNGQTLYLGNASNNAYIKVREDMQGSSSMWSIPRDGKATFTSLTTPTLSVTESATIANVTIEAGNATLSNLTVNTAATLKQLVVGIDGMSCNAPATFNDFIYGSSITPRTDNYYVLGNNNYKWYAVTAYNVNVHDAITIEAGKELRFKDDNGVVHTLKYDSDKEAFVFDGNVNATGEMSAKKLNA